VYAPPVLLQPEPSDGKKVEATADCGSLDVAPTVKPPVAPRRKKIVVPVADAFVNDPKLRLGVVGALVSTLTTALGPLVAWFPTLSLIV